MPATVIIVNYRNYDDLDCCLEALMPALDADDEVIVVDHESDERKLHAVIDGRRVRTLASPDNRGFAAGVNLAAHHARSPFLLLLNPDTIVQKDVVRELEQWLQQHDDVAVVGPRVLNADGSRQASARRFPGVTTVLGGRSTWLTRVRPNNWWSRRNLPAQHATSPVDVDWMSGVCLMTRRDVFDQLAGLDEAFFLYWEDADYCWRVAQAGWKRTYLPQVAIRHAGGRSATHNLPIALRAFHDSAYTFFRKRAGWAGRLMSPAVRAGLALRCAWHTQRATQATSQLRPASHGDAAPVERARQADVRSLLSYREFVRNLVLKQLRLKYRGSILGVLWSLANPLAMVAVYTLAFRYILGIGQAGFPLFVMLGTLAWTFFANTVVMSATSITDSDGLVRGVRFPRATLPLATVLFNLSQYLLTVTVLLPLMLLIFRPSISGSVLLFPLFLGLQAALIFGAALVLSAATTFYRDVRHFVEVAVSLMFWTTPIVYTYGQLSPWLRGAILLSPMTPFVVAYQHLFYYGTWPDWTLWLAATAHGLGALVIGWLWFASVEDRLGERL